MELLKIIIIYISLILFMYIFPKALPNIKFRKKRYRN